MYYFKSFSRVKSTQDEKVRFYWGNELKLSYDELLSLFHFKSDKGLKFCNRKLVNGEVVLRTWLVYSLTANSVFCIYCKAFSYDETISLLKTHIEWGRGI